MSNAETERLSRRVGIEFLLLVAIGLNNHYDALMYVFVAMHFPETLAVILSAVAGLAGIVVLVMLVIDLIKYFKAKNKS